MNNRLSRHAFHGVWRCLLAAPLILAGLAWAAQEFKPEAAAISPREQAILATAKAFTEAFNRGDAKAVAALWTEDGSLVDAQGQTFKGRRAIEAEYATLFKQYPKAKVDIDINSIEFPSEAVAIEDGYATTAADTGGPIDASRYTAVHLLKDGQWRMASVREALAVTSQSAPKLEDLAWLIGNWEAKRERTRLSTTCQWIANKRFIQRNYAVEQDGVTTSSGVQIIGLDPQAGTIRSWAFDSTGGHGTGFWTPTPEGWHIDHIGTLADGTPISSCDDVIRVAGENNVFGWRSSERRVGADALPDIPEVVLDRIPEKR